MRELREARREVEGLKGRLAESEGLDEQLHDAKREVERLKAQAVEADRLRKSAERARELEGERDEASKALEELRAETEDLRARLKASKDK